MYTISNKEPKRVTKERNYVKNQNDRFQLASDPVRELVVSYTTIVSCLAFHSFKSSQVKSSQVKSYHIIS